MKIRIFLSVLTFVFSISSWAYNGGNVTHVHSYTCASGNYCFLPLASLNAHLYDQGFKTGFTNPIGIGIDRGGEASAPKLNFPIVSYLGFHYLLPQEITAGDSLKMKLNGYDFQFDLFGFNFLNNQNMTLTGGLAWDFGRLKATENSSTQGKTTFTNGYFGPEIRMEFNVCLSEHFFMGIRSSYRHDFTNSTWSRSGAGDAADLPPTIMDGTMVGFFIGIGNYSLNTDGNGFE